MKYIVIGFCILLIILAIFIVIKHIRNGLKGKCCSDCTKCSGCANSNKCALNNEKINAKKNNPGGSS